MRKAVRCCVLSLAALAAACSARPRVDPVGARQEVESVERAFAGTMARRDHAAFVRFLADEAVFFDNDGPLRGKEKVAAGWAPLFDGPSAPFSWEPTQVEVLDSGSLALSSGPVRDPSGKIVGTFNSIWRREAPGVWRIVFDKGGPVCGDGH